LGDEKAGVDVYVRQDVREPGRAFAQILPPNHPGALFWCSLQAIDVGGRVDVIAIDLDAMVDEQTCARAVQLKRDAFPGA
jgi:hypothetical protein